MSRLNKQLRHALREKLLDKRFGQEERELREEEHYIAEQVWLQIVGEHKRRVLGLPKGWLPEARSLLVDHAGYCEGMRLRQPMPIPDNATRRATQPDNEALQVLFERHCQRGRELKQKRRELGGKIRAALDQFYTTNQLKEHWPEAHALLPVEQKATLPSVPVRELNQELGL